VIRVNRQDAKASVILDSIMKYGWARGGGRWKGWLAGKSGAKAHAVQTLRVCHASVTSVTLDSMMGIKQPPRQNRTIGGE